MPATPATQAEVYLYCIDGTSVPSAVIDLALADAAVYANEYGINTTHENYSIMHRLYALHILYMLGYNLRLTGFGIGDHNQSMDSLNQGDRTGDSPFLMEFRKLAGGVYNFPVVE